MVLMKNDIEQYKMFVESAEKNSEKIINQNNIYLTFSLALFSFISITELDKLPFYILCILGIIISIIWFFTIDNYSKRNKVKFDIINEYEKENGLNWFVEEHKRISVLTNLSFLEKLDLSKYFVQTCVDENYDNILSNFANVNLVVCIGNHNLQMLIAKKSRVRTIFSGYENFDLYIEDASNLEFLNKILYSGVELQLYINSSANLSHPKAIMVDDIDEAITQINYNGNGYSAAIFTKSSVNASKFINEVKSKMVTVNASPTIERLIDIKMSDLTIEKIIVYPANFKYNNGNQKTIEKV